MRSYIDVQKNYSGKEMEPYEGGRVETSSVKKWEVSSRKMRYFRLMEKNSKGKTIEEEVVLETN